MSGNQLKLTSVAVVAKSLSTRQELTAWCVFSRNAGKGGRWRALPGVLPAEAAER